MSAAQLLDRLEKVKQTGPGRWIARCPAHEDRSPSLSIRELDDGRVLLHCFGGCGALDVLDALGLQWCALFPPNQRHAERPATCSRIPARDLLELISEEVTVVAVVAADLLANKFISEATGRGSPRPRTASPARGITRMNDKVSRIEKARAQLDQAVIEVRAGEMPRIVVEAQAALLAGRAGIYQRSGQLVRRAAGSIVITPVAQEYLTCALAACARFERYDGRVKKTRTIDPPPAVSATLLALVGRWKFPVLTGIVTAPTLRPDGSLLDRPGYDAATGLFGQFDPADFPTIRPKPSRESALAALALLKDLFSECAFTGGPDSTYASAAIAATLTAAVRRALPIAPAFGVTAPKASCGKSTIAKAISQVCSGYEPAVKSPPDSETEFRKFMLGLLMAGDLCLVIDNLDAPVKSAAFCAVLTSSTYSDRILGVNAAVTVPTATTWLLTGNGLQFVGDLTTRALLIEIAQQLERPEEREYKRDLPAYIAEHRGELLAAALTIPLAYLAAGEPRNKARLRAFESGTGSFAGRCCGSASPTRSPPRPSCAGAIRNAKRSWAYCMRGTPLR